MSSYEDGLPDDAFTETERAAGVPGMLRGGSSLRHPHTARSAKVTEEDCIALIVRSLVMGDLNCWSLIVWHPDDCLGVDYDFCNLSGLTPSTIGNTDYCIIANGHRIAIPMLLNALRRIGIPLFRDDAWLAWDEASQSLVTDLAYQGGHLHRCFWPDGLGREVKVPEDSERARVFKLLRTAYLSSDHGKKPLLLHNGHLGGALAKKAVPFEEPKTISRIQADDYSLVYFTPSGDVTSLPLSKACNENVTVSTRTASYFWHGQFGGPRARLRPSFNEAVLWANGLGMSVASNPQKFRYFLRRNRGTVFQSAFEQIDLPSSMRFWHSMPASIDDQARNISDWADERNTQVYVTVDGHPLHTDDCFSVTTPQLYARAVRKLQECGFHISNASSSADVDVFWTSAGKPAGFSEGPYAQPWMPAALQSQTTPSSTGPPVD